MGREHHTVVRKRWIVTTKNTETDLSHGRSEVPLTWLTTVTDIQSGWKVIDLAKYPTEDAARRGHNTVVKHLKGGGSPTHYPIR
jgi:hypothetical protein